MPSPHDVEQVKRTFELCKELYRLVDSDQGIGLEDSVAESICANNEQELREYRQQNAALLETRERNFKRLEEGNGLFMYLSGMSKDAVSAAGAELVRSLQADYGCEFDDSYMLLKPLQEYVRDKTEIRKRGIIQEFIVFSGNMLDNYLSNPLQTDMNFYTACSQTMVIRLSANLI